MDNIISAVAAAIITGLGVLAYHHPRRYAQMAPYLAGGCAAIAIGMFIWLIAIQQAEFAVMDIVPRAPFETSLDKIGQATAYLKPSVWLIMGIGGGGLALFGAVLPWIGTLNDPG